MPPRIDVGERRVLAALLTLLATGATPDYSYVGVQGLALVGVHRDVAGSEYGIGAGPLLEVHAGGSRFAVHLEGIPVVSIPGTRPSVTYGQATPALGIFNGDAEYAVDRRGQIWLGLGETIYNQRTPLPAQAQTVSSRLAGARFTLRLHRSFGTSHFVEAFVGTAPYLTGSDVYVYLDGAPNTIKPERASEVDASLEFGYTRNRSQWLFGVRTLNFSAMYPLTGEAADRNVGIGPVIEFRELL
jgi:hypothetical protein